MQLGNALNWFEIPVSDFARAKKFYETIFNYQMPESKMDDATMGFLLFDFEGGKVGGAIVHHPGLHTPSQTGALVYLNCNPDLQIILDRVNAAGGKIVSQKTQVSAEQEHLGFWALIHDCEGNRVALHSGK
jgi:predicted enzyme related to lactoylglutathione lyase